MSGKDNATKVDDPLGTNHLAVCCDVGQVTFEARFGACYTRNIDERFLRYKLEKFGDCHIYIVWIMVWRT